MNISLRMWLWCIAMAAWIILIRAVEEAVRAVA